jgi:hypothetical protein
MDMAVQSGLDHYFDTLRTVPLNAERGQSVLHLKFRGNQLVTCSKDFRVILWQQDAVRTCAVCLCVWT